MKTIAKVGVGFFSMGAGYGVALGGTVPGWKPLIVITNIGVDIAYGSIGARGVYYSILEVFGSLFSKQEKKSCLSTMTKVVLVTASTGLGFFAQLPFSVVAWKFRGKLAGAATQAVGSGVLIYSMYELLDWTKDKATKLPFLNCSLEKKIPADTC